MSGSTAVMNTLLSWLKNVARWVLGLFDLAGSGFSPLKWLSEHWLTLLIVLMIIGVIADLVVWLLRWRPYWVWFNKKRIVIDDDDYFAGEDLVDSGLYDPELFDIAARRPAKKRKRNLTLIEKVDEDGIPVRRDPMRTKTPRRDPRLRSRRDDSLFSVNPDMDEDERGSEDEVFNVSDLPVSQDELTYRNNRRRSSPNKPERKSRHA